MERPPRQYVEIGLETETIEFELTPTQEHTLRPGRKIGCGASACAYLRPDGRVVKFTFDDNAVDGALRAKKAECAVVRVDEAYRLPQIVNGEHVFVSIEERLAKLEPVSRRIQLKAARDLIGDYSSFVAHALKRSKKPAAFRLGNKRRRKLTATMCSGSFKLPSEKRACVQFSAEIARLIECVGRAGLAVNDVRVPNVGLDAKGRLKLLDVSHEDVARRAAIYAGGRWREPGEDWPVLEGGRLRGTLASPSRRRPMSKASHPSHCRAQLSKDRRSGVSLSSSMKRYQACRRAAGAIGGHGAPRRRRRK